MDNGSQVNGGAAAAPQAGSVPSAPANQTGGDTITVSRQEWESAQRWGQQVKGYQPFFEKARSLGFEKPEHFDEWAPAIRTMRERGINPRHFPQAFGPQVTEPDGGDQPRFDPDAFEKKLRAELAEERAWESHRSAYESEGKVIDTLLADLADGDADDFTRELYRRALRDYSWEVREQYPEGHPLHTKAVRALDEAMGKKAVGYFKDLRTKAQAKKMAAVGAAAGKEAGRAPPSTAAGAGGGQGPTKTKEERAGRPPSREQAQARLNEIRARRGGAPVSSLGG